MKFPSFLLILSLFSSQLLSMEIEAQDSIEVQDSVVISPQEFLLFFKNKFKYDLFDNYFEYNYFNKLGDFRVDIDGIFNQLSQSFLKKKRKPVNENLRDFFIELGLKQDKEYLEHDEYLEKIKKLEPKQIFSLAASNDPLDIIHALKRVFISYYEEGNIKKRRLLEDCYGEPYIAIIISRISEQQIIIIGTPAAKLVDIFTEDIDYLSLFNEQPAQWPIYVAALTSILAKFVPSVHLKFPSIVDSWGAQMNNDVVQENHLNELGLSSSASPSEIKDTCRALKLQYHPDKNRSPDAPVKFQSIQTSCDFLKKAGQ